MKRESWLAIHAHLARCCAAFFRDHGLDVSEHGPVDDVGPHARSIVAVIGFSGPQLTGSLAVLLTSDVIDASRPVHDVSERSDAARLDWAGEVANQLLGRLKNRLLRRGLVLHLSTPMTFMGRDVLSAGERHAGFTCLRFYAEKPPGSHPFDVVFDAEAEEHVELAPDEGSAPHGVGESSVLFF